MSKEKRIKRLAERIKDDSSLCEFMGNIAAEYMAAQTIRACRTNLNRRKEAFGFKHESVNSADNAAGFKMLIDQGYVVEESQDFPQAPARTCRDEDGRPIVLVPTEKLLSDLEEFFGL